MRCGLVWAFAALLGRYSSWRLVLEIATLVGIVFVIGLHLIIPDIKSWWSGHLLNYLNEMGAVTAWKLTSAQVGLLIKKVVPIASGVAYLVVMIGTLLQLLLARWWQAVLFNPGGLHKEFIHIRVGHFWAVSMLIVIAILFLKTPFIVDLIPVLMLPFMVSGLSLFHLLVSVKKGLLLPLVMIYMGLFLLPLFIMMLLTCTGYLDSWYDFRRRLKA